MTCRDRGREADFRSKTELTEKKIITDVWCSAVQGGGAEEEEESWSL